MKTKRIKISQDHFARLFVLCTQSKTNLRAFSNLLMNYDNLILTFEETDVVSLVDLFNEITGLYIEYDTSYGDYNDAYWCGVAYFYIKKHLNKPLSYVLLKLPFDVLINLYNPYHEADFSKTLEYFKSIENTNSILKLLCQENKISLSQLSVNTGISLNTIKKFYKKDEFLYSGSFQYILKIARYFDITPNLFVKYEGE